MTAPVLTMLVLTMELLLVLVLSSVLVGALVPLRGQPARSLMAPTARTTST